MYVSLKTVAIVLARQSAKLLKFNVHVQIKEDCSYCEILRVIFPSTFVYFSQSFHALIYHFSSKEFTKNK